MTVEIMGSTTESRRFGLRVGRLELTGEEPADEVRTAVLEGVHDVVIAVMTAGGRLTPHALDGGALNARVMDVRVTWGGVVTVRPEPTDLFELTTWGPEFDTAITDMFRGYRNHMSRDSEAASTLVAAGYAEWCAAHVGGDDMAVIGVGARDAPALAAVSMSTTDTTIRVDLAGVAPSARGRGNYSRLLDGVEGWAIRRNLRHLRIATQADNIAPQRAWARRGWLPVSSEWVVHLRVRS